jgi:nucleotide-binding universal stress UspA family protein
VLIESGKPAIVVPAVGSFGTLGERVLIAWKPGRESARALAAAMPILQRAASVHYVVDGRCEWAAAELGGCLRAHGVKAPLKRHAALDAAAPGESLLSLAADCDADLLVMGCYGHSRAREWAMGGATRTVLASMTLPVLMAH